MNKQYETAEFDIFCNKIKLAMENHFGDDYTIRISEVNKLNGLVLHGLTILKKTKNICPTIYLETYFDAYLAGKTLGETVNEIISLYNNSDCLSADQLDFFSDYEQVKSHLMYKLMNYEMNRELLANVPYRKFLDLALVCIVRVDIDGHGFGNVMVHNNHICMWGISRDRLFADARNSTLVCDGFHVLPMEEMIEEIRSQFGSEDAFSDTEAEDIVSKSTGMHVVTNNHQTYGAALIVYEQVLEGIAQALESDFFILPSSIHEVIVIPKDIVSDPGALNDMIREVNGTILSKEDILSDHAYLYMREEKAIINVLSQEKTAYFD